MERRLSNIFKLRTECNRQQRSPLLPAIRWANSSDNGQKQVETFGDGKREFVRVFLLDAADNYAAPSLGGLPAAEPMGLFGPTAHRTVLGKLPHLLSSSRAALSASSKAVFSIDTRLLNKASMHWRITVASSFNNTSLYPETTCEPSQQCRCSVSA